MEIFYVLLILLVITSAFGEIAVRLGQPALVGELLAGIVLGAAIQFSPSSFPVMHAVPENEVFTAITDLGIFFLMLMTGLEILIVVSKPTLPVITIAPFSAILESRR